MSLREDAIRVDATDALQHEWAAFIEAVRNQLVEELRGAEVTVCNEPAGTAAALSPGSSTPA